MKREEGRIGKEVGGKRKETRKGGSGEEEEVERRWEKRKRKEM